MVLSSNLTFRNGIEGILTTLTELKVPLVIVSAAITDVVEQSFELLID